MPSPWSDERRDVALEDVAEELRKAMKRHSSIHSAHEGYAVILEELDEVKAEVWRRQHDPALLRKELVQVAAMAVRMIVDLNL